MSTEVKCPYCGRAAELVRGSAVYPHRPDLARDLFHVCWPCQAWNGCHKGTDEPTGRLANAELRRAKMMAHREFDVIWQWGMMHRNEAYGWLAQKMGLDREHCHIGMFDVAQCDRVVEVAREYIKLKQRRTGNEKESRDRGY